MSIFNDLLNDLFHKIFRLMKWKKFLEGKGYSTVEQTGLLNIPEIGLYLIVIVFKIIY